jgi:hypothetical protein
MARSITFSGITRYTPGGITRVNAEALNQVLSSDNSIIGLVGEADGGAPGAVAGLVTMYDPSRSTDLFRSGPLVDAIKLAFQSSNDPAIPGGASKVYVWKTNNSTSSSVALPSSAEEQTNLTVNFGISNTTEIAITGTTFTTNQYQGYWLQYTHGVAGATYVRKITSNTTSSLLISPALPATPITGSTVDVYANSINVISKDWGLHTNSVGVDVAAGSLPNSTVVTVSFEGAEEVSPDLGGNVMMHLLYKGGTQGAVSGVTVNPTGTTTTNIALSGTALTPSAHVGKQVLISGEYTEITANTANALTVSPPFSTIPTGAVSIRTVGPAIMTISGASGAATGLTTTITGVTGDNLTLTFAAGQTVRQLMDIITQNTNYEAVAGQGINPDTTYVADLDFGATAVFKIIASTNISTTGATRNTMAVVDYLNNFSQYVNATRSTSSPKGGSLPPSVTAEAVRLVGGTRGTSTNTDFQNGLNELLTLRCNSVVPLIDQDLTHEGYGSLATVASVAAQLAGHVAFARGAGQDTAGERGGFIGFRGNKAAVIKQANSINDMDVALVAQNPTAVNGLGSLQEYGPRMFAVMAASMRAGVQEVAEPLTHKAIRVAGITQDPSWNPTDISDANEMIINGILFAESIDGVGTHWVRDLTTWVKDDNLAYSEGSVRDAVRYVAQGLRTTLIARFTGKKATPATIGNVKDAAATYLETAREGNIIVDSTDPATGVTIKAYHNLKVYSSGDVLRINVGIFPVPGINFQLNDIFLQLPTQAA